MATFSSEAPASRSADTLVLFAWSTHTVVSWRSGVSFKLNHMCSHGAAGLGPPWGWPLGEGLDSAHFLLDPWAQCQLLVGTVNSWSLCSDTTGVYNPFKTYTSGILWGPKKCSTSGGTGETVPVSVGEGVSIQRFRSTGEFPGFRLATVYKSKAAGCALGTPYLIIPSIKHPCKQITGWSSAYRVSQTTLVIDAVIL